MITSRGLRIGRSEYAQQGEYSKTKSTLIDGQWCWPVLLVYATREHGEQSDYLESVAENVTMDEIIELVFGEGTEPPR